ncbi:MAG: chaperone NapD [Magnetospirillum sp. WYHS-4]
MSISSLVLHAKPEDVERVRKQVLAIAGTDIHAVSPEGKIVVTLDDPDTQSATDKLTELHKLDGVQAAALVYTYFEDENRNSSDHHFSNAAGKEEAHDVIQA